MKENRTKAILKIILAIIFIGYACSISFFSHAHVVNGVTIVHSHPYLSDENGNSNHEHSGVELQLIQFLSIFFSTAFILFSFLLGLFSLKKRVFSIKRYFFLRQNTPKGLFRLRPPPVFVV